MTIVFGTDFSEASRRGLGAAAAVARVRGTELVVVHVLDIPGAEEVLTAHEDAAVTRFFEAEKARLEALLAREVANAKSVGVSARFELLLGRADEAVVRRARELHARLLVVAAFGRRGPGLWLMGSTAERIAQTASSPALVVRDEVPFLAWARGERRLRVVVGIDFSATADAALAWAAGLAAPEGVDLVGAHVVWPPDVIERSGRMPIGELGAEAAAEIERDLRARVAEVAAGRTIDVRIVGGLGRPADHLVQLCADEHADLLVVGTHRRTGLAKLWHGSVSRDALERSRSNVTIVPAS